MITNFNEVLASPYFTCFSIFPDRERKPPDWRSHCRFISIQVNASSPDHPKEAYNSCDSTLAHSSSSSSSKKGENKRPG